MGNLGCHSCQRLQQCNFFDEQQIRSSPLKNIVLLDHDPCIDIAGHDARQFIALAVEDVIVGIRDAAVDGDL